MSFEYIDSFILFILFYVVIKNLLIYNDQNVDEDKECSSNNYGYETTHPE
jgi:hypothetical protein